MEILFMGTPDFAASALTALLDAGFSVCAAVTQPDKPKGRRQILTPPPVKCAALARNIPVYQPGTLRDGTFFSLLRELSPTLIAVAAYGKILPKEVLDFPPLGCVNLHASLLPAYRGAAPIQRAILSGERVTGVTTMQMNEGLDTGDILEKAEVEIDREDTFGSVHDKLAVTGSELLVSTVTKLEMGILTPIPQNAALATYAEKIKREDGLLDFSRSAEELHDQIRGLSPLPLAYTTLRGKGIKIVSSTVLCHTRKNMGTPGTVISIDDGIIAVECGASILGIREVLPEGKSRMTAAAFICGRGVAKGDVFGGITPEREGASFES